MPRVCDAAALVCMRCTQAPQHTGAPPLRRRDTPHRRRTHAPWRGRAPASDKHDNGRVAVHRHQAASAHVHAAADEWPDLQSTRPVAAAWSGMH
eukprot:364918-Chlamydomonas_euryale.AAC.18